MSHWDRKPSWKGRYNEYMPRGIAINLLTICKSVDTWSVSSPFTLSTFFFTSIRMGARAT